MLQRLYIVSHTCTHTQIAQTVAKAAGKTLEVKVLSATDRTEKELKTKNPLDRYPMLECPEGVLFDTLAICKYLSQGTTLMGSSRSSAAKVISDIRMIETQVAPCLTLASSVMYGTAEGV